MLLRFQRYSEPAGVSALREKLQPSIFDPHGFLLQLNAVQFERLNVLRKDSEYFRIRFEGNDLTGWERLLQFDYGKAGVSATVQYQRVFDFDRKPVDFAYENITVRVSKSGAIVIGE